MIKSMFGYLFMAGSVLFVSEFEAQAPTWAKDIAPILYKNCTSCHHSGGLAPNSLTSFSDAFNYRFQIKSYVEQNMMPPWPPDPKYKRLAHERVISQTDKDKISNWVLANAPEGNPADAPAPPVYSNGSQLSGVNYSAKMQNYMVNTGNDLYRCFVINTNFTTDKFASEIEVIPGNSSIVHHVLVYEDTTNAVVFKDSADAGAGYTSFFGTGSNDSRLIGEWVPGTQPIKFPSSLGIRLRKNTRLILQVHYPKGTYLKMDSTRVNIKFTNPASFPQFREVYLAAAISEADLTNGPLVIPAGVIKTFTATSVPSSTVLPFNAFTLLSIAPHMHLIGDRIKVFAIENGTKDTIPLINIPKWDFKWQGIYNFRNLIKIVSGSTLIAQSAYDNTSANPENPNSPPKQVTQGESTTDEMMLVFFAFTYYLPGDENIVVDNSPLVGMRELTRSSEKELQLFDIFPNPARSKATINYFSPANETCHAKITAVDGKLVKAWQENVCSGFNEMALDLSSLAKGQYLISLTNSSITKSKTLMVYE